MEDPPDSIAPRYVQGPARLGAVWMAIFPPVEKRKYVPSLLRTIEGSWELVQVPLQASGTA